MAERTNCFRQLIPRKNGLLLFPNKDKVASTDPLTKAILAITIMLIGRRSKVGSKVTQSAYKVEDIDRDWNETNPHIRVFPISKETMEKIKKKAPKTVALTTLKNITRWLSTDTRKATWPKFYTTRTPKSKLPIGRSEDHKGIMALATGSGKTIMLSTNLTTKESVLRQKEKKMVLVAAPTIVLAEQWCQVMVAFNMEPLKCYINRNKWQTNLNTNITTLNLRRGGF